MSPMSKAFASFAAIAALSSPVAAQGLVTQKNIPLAMAQTRGERGFIAGGVMLLAVGLSAGAALLWL